MPCDRSESSQRASVGIGSKASSKPAKAAAIKSDIIIAIKTPYMNNIVSRIKDHEFRNYLIPDTVERMWFYVSRPDQTLRYVATISKGKRPGQIKSEDGLGNADFNTAPKDNGAKYAYEILRLYKLRVPLSISEMKRAYGLAVPQRYVYVPKKLFEDAPLQDQERLF